MRAVEEPKRLMWILNPDVDKFAPALHSDGRGAGKGDLRMGVIALGKDKGDPAQAQRPAKGRGELQVGRVSRRTQFCGDRIGGAFQSPRIFPAGISGDERPDGSVGRSGDVVNGAVIADAAVVTIVHGSRRSTRPESISAIPG